MTSRRPVVSWLLCVCAGALVGCTATAPPAVTSSPGTVTIGTITHIEPPTQTITRTVSDPNNTRSVTASKSAPSPGSSTATMTKVTTTKATTTKVMTTKVMTTKVMTTKVTTTKVTTTKVTTTTTPEPAPRQADCPYLDGAELQLMSGERTGTITVIDMTPQPICQFYRIVDGDWQVAVRVFQTSTPQAAIAAVDTRIPPADSSPADQPAGWTGGYMPLSAGSPASADFPHATSVYGVSKGNRAVVVWTNRETVRNRTIAVATIKALHW